MKINKYKHGIEKGTVFHWGLPFRGNECRLQLATHIKDENGSYLIFKIIE